MDICIDAEFTGLQHPTSLISLGMVSENDEALYIEFNTFERSQINDWLKENVLDNLFILKDKHFADCSVEFGYAGGQLNNSQSWNSGSIAYTENSSAKTLIINWLKQFNEDIQIISDCSSYDWVLFCQIFKGALNLPEFISPYCHDINQDIANHFGVSDRKAFNLNREKIAIPEKTGRVLRNVIQDFQNLTGAKDAKHNALWDALVTKECFNIVGKQAENE